VALKVYDNNEDIQITEHFSSSELKCKCGKCKISLINEDHVEMLEELRTYLGVPIHINSGYRCYDHNKEVGGSPKSRHLCGDATDIVPLGRLSLHELSKHLYFDGIGYYNNFIHVDSRGEKAFWDFRTE